MDEEIGKIILLYNGYNIDFNLPFGFEECYKAIKDKLYLSNKEMESAQIYYEDEDDYVLLNKDNYESGFMNAKIWKLEKFDKNKENKSKLKKLKSNYQNIISQKSIELDSEMKKSKDTIMKICLRECKKILEEKKSVENKLKNSEKKIKKLENKIQELNKTFKNLFADIKSKYEKLIDNLVELTNSKIEESISNYNNIIIKEIDKNIKESELNCMNELKQIDFNKLEKIKDDVEKDIINSKDNFREFFQSLRLNKNDLKKK